MDDMTVFEQRVAGEVIRGMGPSEPVDDLAIFNTIVAATQSPKWRFQSMFSATKFVLAGAIVALFGGFLLSGVFTQPSDEPLPPAAASASASPEAVPSAGPTTNDLLPGVALVTEEVEPGVFRVVSDGVRDLSKRVRDVTVTPEGDVWVELGTPRNWKIIRLGEPGVSTKLGWKDPWRLFTLDGAPGVVGGGGWRLFDGEAWTDYEPSTCDSARALGDPGGITADGGCWITYSGLDRVDDDGAYDTVHPEEIGLGYGRVIDSGTVAEDGTLWATVHSYPPGEFEGLVRYDGSTWEQVPYDQSAESPVDGLNWVGDSNVVVGPDGTVWVVDQYRHRSSPAVPSSLTFLLTSWDGDAWTTYGPVEAAGIDRESLRRSTNSYFLDDGTVWFHDGLLVLDAEGLRSQELPGFGDMVFGPDGSAWSFTEGGLYVITPEAVAATE